MKLSGATIFDAPLIAAPPSTKNEERSRDPEMHQSKKSKQWHFGLKVCASGWTARAA
jgi:IS5 family transposase